jgi:fibro-slime domain-containing protein
VKALALFVVCVATLGACGGGGGGGGAAPPDGGLGEDAAAADAATEPPGPICGDGVLDPGEVCDDGNTASGDGCRADCSAAETGWLCGEAGIACVHDQVCGNGILEAGETCDDHNTQPGDGCDASCGVELGWSCPIPGVRCTAAMCGDGVIAGFEECDDGNATAGDGCSASCTLEDGHACDTAGLPCRTTTCGDGIPEGTEQCDDGNHDLGDGCDPLCHREPKCSDGVCEAVCGDGVVQTGEACDDGNLHNADGCSSACTVETGFTCMGVSSTEPATLAVAVVYRDFRGNDLPGGHPDFENHNGTDRGIVAADLGSDHKPVYASATTTPTTAGAAAFQSWYRDTPGVNMTYAETLVLTRTGPATYVYDNGAFFPLDGRGFVGAGTEPKRTNGHNFSFTSELRYWFDYKGGEVLTFRGDDDVWVFINGKLALDLGGVHGAQTDTVTLNAATATKLNLHVGGTYEAVVLQAERHTTASSYKLTLQGFNAVRSTCDDTCGDAVTSADEVCDDGVNQGGYNSCALGCLGFGPRCGDGVVQAGFEECDDGVNSGAYGTCTPTCTLAPRCGDGIIQPGHETCDDQDDTDPTDGCNQCHLTIN